jgi:hypothetical protein
MAAVAETGIRRPFRQSPRPSYAFVLGRVILSRLVPKRPTRRRGQEGTPRSCAALKRIASRRSAEPTATATKRGSSKRTPGLWRRAGRCSRASSGLWADPMPSHLGNGAGKSVLRRARLADCLDVTYRSFFGVSAKRFEFLSRTPASRGRLWIGSEVRETLHWSVRVIGGPSSAGIDWVNVRAPSPR